MLGAQRAQRLKKTGHRRNAVHVAGNWLDNHAGDVIAIRSEETLQSIRIVIGKHMGEIGIGLWYAE